MITKEVLKNPEFFLNKKQKQQGDNLAKKLSYLKFGVINFVDVFVFVGVMFLLNFDIIIMFVASLIYIFFKQPDYREQLNKIEESFK